MAVPEHPLWPFQRKDLQHPLGFHKAINKGNECLYTPTHPPRKPTLLCVWLAPPGQEGEFCRNKWLLEPIVSWVLCQWVFRLLACRIHGTASFTVLFGLELGKLQAMALATVTQKQWTHLSVGWVCSVLLCLKGFNTCFSNFERQLVDSWMWANAGHVAALL